MLKTGITSLSLAIGQTRPRTGFLICHSMMTSCGFLQDPARTEQLSARNSQQAEAALPSLQRQLGEAATQQKPPAGQRQLFTATAVRQSSSRDSGLTQVVCTPCTLNGGQATFKK
jgi:hypothetical protein